MGTDIKVGFNSRIDRLQPVSVHCASCGHNWAPCFAPAPMDLVAKALENNRCPLCGHDEHFVGLKPVEVTEVGALDEWRHGTDTGISSLTIFSVLSGQDVLDGWRPGVPRDPSDFGRCYRLLKIAPGWRERLDEVSARYPAWTPLVAAWDELTALYEEEQPTGQAPKLYARMQQLRGEA